MIAVFFGAVAIAMYLYAVRRYNARFPARPFGVWRIAPFIAGVMLFVAALLPPLDALAERSFAAHMVQHVVLLLVAPPLVLLGAPMLLLVAVPDSRTARRITSFAHSAFGQALFAPVTGWLLLVAILWGSHFSPLYETALDYPAVHVLEHALYVGAAFLFWSVVVQVGYAPRAVPFPARMLYIFLAIPQGAFLGLAIYAARGVLYPHYLDVQGAAALTDQQNGGAVMWILGGFLLFVAFMLTAGAWAACERRAPVRP